jgi:ABC-type lipoprotein release transport system permease subunit
MKISQTFVFTFLVALCISFTSMPTLAVDVSQQIETVPVYLTIRFRDYNTGIAVANLSVTVGAYTYWGISRISNRTDEIGVVQITLGNIEKSNVPQATLDSIELSDNYMLIKVQNTFIEELPIFEIEQNYGYQAEYNANHTKYSRLNTDLSNKVLTDRQYIEGTIWVIKGKLVRILDCDPVTGTSQNLIVTPAFLTNIPNNISTFEHLYFFPINYEVTIYHKTQMWQNIKTEKLRYPQYPFSPLIVKIDENTTLINWMYHAAVEYVERQTYRMDREIELLNSTGYPLDMELEEYNSIKSLWNRVLRLYEKGEIPSAFGGAKISDKKFLDLMGWLYDNIVMAVLTAVGISLFAYGLGSLLSNFFFNEPSQNKIRLITKVLVFSLVMLLFSLSHPALKITFVMLIGSRSVTLPLSLLGCLVIEILTYFIMQLLSVRQKAMTDLAIQLGVRSLKRRKSRTLLTLLTIVIIVSSAIVFVNISVNRETKFEEQWVGTNVSGVLVEPDTAAAPITEYDVNWTRLQQWCKDLSYTESMQKLEELPTGSILSRVGFIIAGGENHTVDIVGIDPSYLEKYYNFSEHVTGFWNQFIEGKPVVIVPSDFNFLVNEPVYLGVTEAITVMESTTPGRRPNNRILGEFRVVGVFDSATAFSGLKKLDNTSLFENPSGIVLVPLRSINDSALVISEVTILVNQGFNPVDVARELAYTLAVTTISNHDGLAQKIVWSTEFSVTGLIPYLPPLVIAGLMMYTTMISVYEERKKEFSTLATLGLDPGNTLQVFLVEALLLGLMGTFIGFFGSYLLVAGLDYLTNFLATPGLGAPSITLSHWSMPSILVALLTGVVMVFLGGYIPAKRARGVSLMGREQKRDMVGELITSGNVTALTLPIRESVQNSELLYSYVKETIGKFKPSLVDSHSVRGELYRDGTFIVFFIALTDTYKVTVPCNIKGIREGSVLVPIIQFPTGYRSYERIRLIVRDLEQYMIGFSSWKDMQLRMTIVREAPRRAKTLEEIVAEIKEVMDQVKDYSKKLRILDGQRGKLSDTIYNEFREKYTRMVEEKSKTLRTMTINLEPHRRQLSDEIRKTEVEVERITTSYNLGETTEEEFVKTCGPLQAKLAELRNKEKEMEEIFNFLKKPLGMEYT